MPDELWTEVRDIVQKVMIKAIPMEETCKKAKWLFEEPLHIVRKRRESEAKGEKKIYIHLNAEFQRIARTDKKAFLNEQCKEIEENKIIGKTRYFFNKIRDIKVTFLGRMGTIKDRNDKDLIEAEDFKNG